ncbi:MAG: glycosyltransferase family 4 protein [Epsilonproteobacteria bacterium]|nr:glycosyltransferase family 4 protein [Campylobacterota bacterium]
MSQRKKLLIIAENFYPEEFRINDLVNELQEGSFDVAVITQNPTYPFAKVYDGYSNALYSKSSYNGITIYRVKALTGYNKSLFKKIMKYMVFAFLGSVVALFIAKRFDHIFSFHVGSLISTIPAAFSSRMYKKQSTIWTQDIWPDTVYAYGFKKTKLNAYFLDKFIKYIYHSFDNISVSGPGFIEKLRPYVKESQYIDYLPNWAEENNIIHRSDFNLSDTKKIHFTFTGNVGMMQNLKNIVQAFGSLPDEYARKSQLNIVGDGSNLEFLKQLAFENNYENIKFWGRYPSSEMPKFYAASDFLVISLVDQPIMSLVIPLKFQSYLAARKPIFGAINGEICDLITNNNLGYCSGPNNMKSMISNFVKCINASKEDIVNFTKNSDKLLNDQFNRKKTIRKFENIFLKNN